jgi:16S rRNA processing protein RimM
MTAFERGLGPRNRSRAKASKGAGEGGAKPPSEQNERLVVIGQIARPHGLRGQVRVTPRTDDSERFERLETCVLWDTARDERRIHRVTAAHQHGTTVLLSLAGCDSVEAARALAGRLVAVPESEAIRPGPGCFYPWQLEGCEVVTEGGRVVGRVRGIEASPAHDLWVVHDGAGEHLIPAVPAIVVDVDLSARRVVIRPPEGLLEL